MPQAGFDIIIAGAGVAGSSAAISLAPEGYRILLLDKAVFPRDKSCGEGIMPSGVRILSEFGCLDGILARGGTRVQGMRYRNRQGTVAAADFPPTTAGPTFGLAIRRFELDDLLLRKAAAFPNVVVREAFTVRETVFGGGRVRGVIGHASRRPDLSEVLLAPLTLGADGRNSIFHRGCGITKSLLRRRRFGVTGHLEGVAGIGAYVEVQSYSDGEIYIAPCGGDQTLVALLLEEEGMRSIRGNLKGGYLEFLRKTDGFGDRMTRSELLRPVLAAGPLGYAVTPVSLPGLLLLGDSAGFLDPISGEGMTIALRCAKAIRSIVRVAFRSGDFGSGMGREYSRIHESLLGDFSRFTRLLLLLSRHKFLADGAIARLNRDPRLFRKLLGVAAGNIGYRDITLRDRASLFLPR